MPLRSKTRKGKIHEEAKHLMAKSPKFSAREAHGVATRIVTGKGPKKGRSMAKRKRRRYGEKHMDRGVSYANAPQGYYDIGGKPKPNYTHPPNGYIDHQGMPNATRTRKALQHMAKFPRGAGNTNAGTSPKPGAMDPTYKSGGKKGGRRGGSRKAMGRSSY